MNNVVKMNAVAPARSYDLSPAQLSLVKRTVASDCNDSEFDLFVEVCRRVGLDPFRRQIYAIVYSKDNAKKRKMAIITGIDGFRAVAARNGDYRPDTDEPLIVYDPDLKNAASNPLGIERAVYTAYKRGESGEWFPVKASAYWDEFAPLDEGGEWKDTGETWPEGNPKKKLVKDGSLTLPEKSNWRKMPRIMIVKCAEAQALRKGWPEDLSGVYSEEEMERTKIDESASETLENFQQEERTKLIGAKNSIPVIWGAGEGIKMEPTGGFADKVLAFLNESDSPTQIEVFMNTNKAGLQQFWALHQSDALELKKKIEARVAELSAEPTNGEPEGGQV